MKRFPRLCASLLALVLVLVFAGCASPSASTPPPPLLLISLDGFRWDYCALHPAATPRLRELMRTGVSARNLIPVFPSNTFPNHYSIVTGLYPSHHGLINNHLFDPTIGEFFHYNRGTGNHDDRWWGGEPIWATAVLQGRASGCAFWPGDEVQNHGVRPTYWRPYDYKIPFQTRLDDMIGWLKKPDPAARPALLTFYFEEANGAGHPYGPDAPETVAAMKHLDDCVGAILDRLKAEGIAMNVVIVSDHGMTSCGPDRVVILDDYLDPATVQVDFDETCGGLRPLPGQTVDGIMHELEKIPAAQAKAYRVADLPARLHVDPANPRNPPIWIIPAEGWNLMRRAQFEQFKSKFLKGQHGYDPALINMRGILIANGPSFKRDGTVIEPVENVHIYNLLCAALHLKPAPNDGDDRLVKAFLK